MEMSNIAHLSITPMYIALLGILFVPFTMRVGLYRVKNKILIGDGADPEPDGEDHEQESAYNEGGHGDADERDEEDCTGGLGSSHVDRVGPPKIPPKTARRARWASNGVPRGY